MQKSHAYKIGVYRLYWVKIEVQGLYKFENWIILLTLWSNVPLYKTLKNQILNTYLNYYCARIIYHSDHPLYWRILAIPRILGPRMKLLMERTLLSTSTYVKRWKCRMEKNLIQHKLCKDIRKYLWQWLIYRIALSIWYNGGGRLYVLIMKDPSNYWVHCTWPILLKEVHMNENTKRMAKYAMATAEIYDVLVNEQHASRLYRSAMYLATNKQLIYDIYRQMKQHITVCSNDTKSCYDCIVHNVG